MSRFNSLRSATHGTITFFRLRLLQQILAYVQLPSAAAGEDQCGCSLPNPHSGAARLKRGSYVVHATQRLFEAAWEREASYIFPESNL